MNFTVHKNVIPEELREKLSYQPIMSNLLWKEGRQKTGYMTCDMKQSHIKGLLPTTEELFTLMGTTDYAKRLSWDSTLIEYRHGAYIAPHKDEWLSIPPLRHLRINILLAQQGAGGKLMIGGQEVHLEPRDGVFFYPDEDEHEVTPVIEGIRLVWSVGVLWET